MRRVTVCVRRGLAPLGHLAANFAKMRLTAGRPREMMKRAEDD